MGGLRGLCIAQDVIRERDSRALLYDTQDNRRVHEKTRAQNTEGGDEEEIDSQVKGEGGSKKRWKRRRRKRRRKRRKRRWKRRWMREKGKR